MAAFDSLPERRRSHETLFATRHKIWNNKTMPRIRSFEKIGFSFKRLIMPLLPDMPCGTAQ